MPPPFNILLVDDDPDHLKIYGLILKQAGFSAIPCLVARTGFELPAESAVHLVILDYSLHSDLTSAEVAQRLLSAYPSVPIVLLSDVYGLPSDVAPYVANFVRKGEPHRLIETVRRMLAPGVNGAAARGLAIDGS